MSSNNCCLMSHIFSKMLTTSFICFAFPNIYSYWVVVLSSSGMKDFSTGHHTIPYIIAVLTHCLSRTSKVYRLDTGYPSKAGIIKTKRKEYFPSLPIIPPQGSKIKPLSDCKATGIYQNHITGRWLQIWGSSQVPGYFTTTNDSIV